MYKQFKLYLPLVFAIAFFSEIHFYPFDTTLRISLGIIVLNVIGLIKKEIDISLLSFLTGIAIVIERIIYNMTIESVLYTDAFYIVVPALVYYVCYGFLFKMANLNSGKIDIFRTVLILASIDTISNSMEALVRDDFSISILSTLCLVGLLRGIIAFIIYYLWRKQELFIQDQEHQDKYSRLNLLVSSVEAELFYLQKSSHDIEDVMTKCYTLYSEMSSENKNKPKALDIAKDIHEIKKDYIRVISGFDDFLENVQKLDDLHISKIFEIMKINYTKLLKENNKDINISYKYDTDVEFNRYLSVFTILNNLVDNSIAACDYGCSIDVIHKMVDNNHVFEVTDDGSGIPEDITEIIFTPGFTTKFDPETGRASTGIGLVHVKNLVENLGGTIKIDSHVGTGTKFTITIPD